ncbi:MAG: putative glycine dehydrogenase (decarboxylating) subunit 2 [Verrucomicrobia bacterium ADurb.Bin345]|nr:MAG: putative glycine dehydrogenase (decarboxylating) subunit 2 [Verrucomicrobia bacterium ADurb.Bin345]
MKLIYEKGAPGRRAARLPDMTNEKAPAFNSKYLREKPADLPELAEVEVVRHFTELSRLNFSVDTHFYPLGSCTMKYNPKACEAAAALPGFADAHPVWPQLRGGGLLTQGALQLLYETERLLSEICGMAEFTLQPLAGAHGELTGVMLMAAYHRDRGNRKTHIIVPDSAHGTNPASAALGGYDIVTIPSDRNGAPDMAAFRKALNAETAGIMLTCPSTLGLFVPNIREIAEAVHAVDGLMYYDGANLNAILGRVKPGAIGFDVCHLNLHKTFSTPHGGGGPGAGPVGVVEKLRPYLPISRVVKTQDGMYSLDYDLPKSIGYIAPFYGNFGVIVRAYAYILMLGREGLRETSNMAVLNANYVQEKLRPYFEAVAPGRCMHECVFSGKPLGRFGVHTLDIAKGLIDRGMHPPTVYFPLNVPEAIMIEPTETESRETLDRFVDAMKELAALAEKEPDALHRAPVSMPVGRLDEVAAAKNMDLAYTKSA